MGLTMICTKVSSQWTTHTNGIYYNISEKNVGIGTSPNTTSKLYLYNDSEENTLKGLYNYVSGTLSSDNAYGIDNRVYGANDLNYGIKSYLWNPGALAYGIDSYIEDEEGGGQVYGIRSSILLSDPNGGSKYGFYSNLTTLAPPAFPVNTNTYGLFSNMDLDNPGEKYGIYSSITNNFGEGNKYGLYSLISSSASGYQYGVYSRNTSSSSNTRYGVYSRLEGGGTGGNIGMYSYINSSSTGSKYGLYSYIASNGSTNVGVYSYVSSGTGGTKYGVYSSVSGTSNWAGYFVGRSYFSQNVGIGTTQLTDYLLAVDGDVGIDGKLEVDEIEVINVTLPDYVFSDNYHLKSLEEVESYIQNHKHLPEVPSANEVKENGMNITEMNNALLKKIEELTLYVIEQNKRIEQLENQIK